MQAQIVLTRSEQEKFKFDKTPFTAADCIPDKKSESIIGKVVVIDAEPKRYEYQHAAYQLILPMAATVRPAAEVRQSLALVLPQASAADGNAMMSSEKSARSVCRSGRRKPCTL